MKRPIAAVASTAAGLVTVVVLNSIASPAAPVRSPQGTTTKTASGSAPGAVHSATGPSVQYGYGVLSVKVTLRGSRIVDVSLASIQAPESYSQQIAQQAVPILKNEVLAAQSAQVYGVSGATYTSQAYLQSLQAAIDSARS